MPLVNDESGIQVGLIILFVEQLGSTTASLGRLSALYLICRSLNSDHNCLRAGPQSSFDYGLKWPWDLLDYRAELQRFY